MERYCEGKIHKSEPYPMNDNVNAVYFYSLEEIFASVEGSLFAIDEHTIGLNILVLHYQFV